MTLLLPRLQRSFFARPVVYVAKDLIGKQLIFGPHQGILTETEAYGGDDDPASHAFRGPTSRCAVMFGPAGWSYIYMIYGLHFCFNLVTGGEGQASAVLIRGLWIDPLHLDGPGKLCRYLGLNTQHSGLDLMEHPDFFLTQGMSPDKVICTPRIGLSKGKEALWRFLWKRDFSLKKSGPD